jgi:hypothetical protein
MTSPEIRETIVRLFEEAREAKGSPYEPERILAYLAAPAAPSGRSNESQLRGIEGACGCVPLGVVLVSPVAPPHASSPQLSWGIGPRQNT